MRQWLKQNGAFLVVVGVLTLAAGLAYRRPPGGCLLPTPPVDARPLYPSMDPLSTNTHEEEYPMSTSTQTYGQVEHATEANFEQLVLRCDDPVLVDFSADWCAPCRALAPVLEELARENPQTRIVKVNVDNAPGLAAHYRVASIPMVLVFKNGQATAQHVGLANKGQLESMLD